MQHRTLTSGSQDRAAPGSPRQEPAAGARAAWPAGVEATRDYLTTHRFLCAQRGHLFVTGRAGTGKSTLLNCLRELIPGEMAVLAPTGLAAVNVAGQTVHSFFGLPPRLIGPDDIRRSRNGAIMRRLEWLIIDEVSMVRSDLMWAIDQALRVNRGRPRDPFGGVRLVLFGDLHQLAPVVDDGELASHLEATHGGPFFFSITALSDPPGTRRIELTQVFRQRDAALLGVLNRVREGEASVDDLALLNACVRPLATLAEAEAYVVLTPTNAAAGRINAAHLAALTGAELRYPAQVAGDFSDSAYPTDQTLMLKRGAKVMLLRNDAERRWVNGTIARVARLEEKRVWVEIGGEEHEVEPASWEMRRYAYDRAQERVVANVAGTFRQFPLRLAWALTIHKSQGLTIDRVYVDLGRGTFAHGQAYVALSRCRALTGLALARPLRASDIRFDRAVLGYRRLFTPLP
jgi:ATP-dependent exoDNAse (exonuclease V) alpha subunit